jgi:prepilin-type N-terminal cleavage/methylation domain-containing protein
LYKISQIISKLLVKIKKPLYNEYNKGCDKHNTSCLVHELKKERMCFHMKSLKSNKGFTLIELVVVIAILGILAGIAIPRFMDATATARGAKIVADLRTIDSAVMIYNAKTGKYAYKKMADLLKDTAVTGTTTTPQFKLLASEPKPTTGTAIFPCQPTVKVNVTSTGYTLDVTDTAATGTTAATTASGRAKIGGHTADELAEGGSFTGTTL